MNEASDLMLHIKEKRADYHSSSRRRKISESMKKQWKEGKRKYTPIPAKSRKKAGEKNALRYKGLPARNRKINELCIKELRNRIERGSTLTQLAKRYNVSTTTIWRIKNNLYYK